MFVRHTALGLYGHLLLPGGTHAENQLRVIHDTVQWHMMRIIHLSIYGINNRQTWNTKVSMLPSKPQQAQYRNVSDIINHFFSPVYNSNDHKLEFVCYQQSGQVFSALLCLVMTDRQTNSPRGRGGCQRKRKGRGSSGPALSAAWAGFWLRPPLCPILCREDRVTTQLKQ